MNDFGKQQYAAIPIPEALDQVLWAAMGRVEQEERRRCRVRKWLASSAAVFLLFFSCANIAPAYAYAADLPVIGSIVRVLHIGAGGQRTDGAVADSTRQSETVDLHFETASGKLDAVPSYTVSHLLAPDRIVLTLHGVRGMDFPVIQADLLAAEAVRDVYRSMIGDDSACGFVVVLESGYTYEITEFSAPAALSIRFFQSGEERSQEIVYYLCSQEMPYGEGLGWAAERFAAEGATQLKTASGQFVVTVGQYATEAEAADALQALEEKYGETDLRIASGTAYELP